MKLLFVCTGNTCRSPMAQELAKLYFSNKVEIISAGINALAGDRISVNAPKVLSEMGIDLCRHRALRLTEEMLKTADYVVTMTKAQAEYLRRTHPGYEDKIKCLGSWAGQEEDVPDPWGGSLATYRLCAQKIIRMVAAFSQRLKDAGMD